MIHPNCGLHAWILLSSHIRSEETPGLTPEKAPSTVFHPQESGRAPLPQPAARGRGRRSGRPRAWYPVQPAPQRRPPWPVRLTSARAGSGTFAASDCGCSFRAGAGGPLFRWLRSSSGTARTPAGTHSSGTSRSRSSQRTDARPLPRAAAIPPAETAAAGGSVGYRKPRP